jgi:hypothetical protein
MTDDRGVVRYVSWRDLFPWLILLRTFRIAISPQLLAVATAATLLMSLGWWVGGWVFLHHKDEVSGRWVVRLPEPRRSLADQLPSAVREYLPDAATGLLEPYYRLAEPLRQVFGLNQSLTATAYYLFGTLWSLAVWALAGGIITRHAVVELATEGSPGISETVMFALRRYWWYFLTPLYPLLGVLLIAIPIALLGLPIRLAPGLGSILAGLLWIFVVIASLGAVWLLGGLLFGWPLMWPAVSAEREGDPFEAFSRSFSYVYGKPLHYLFYAVVAALFGALCFAVVVGAATLVTEFGFWALAWGGGGDNVVRIRTLVEWVLSDNQPALKAEPNRALVLGSSILAILVGLIRLTVTAYTFSFFWCVASAIYLLLRQDVDEKELDEVFLDQPKPVLPAEPGKETASPVVAAPEATAGTAPGDSGGSRPPLAG